MTPSWPGTSDERPSTSTEARVLGRIRSAHHTWGVIHLSNVQLLSARVRASIVIFPPGTTAREATYLVRYFAWCSWLGFAAAVAAFPLIVVVAIAAVEERVMSVAGMVFVAETMLCALVWLVLHRRVRRPLSATVIVRNIIPVTALGDSPDRVGFRGLLDDALQLTRDGAADPLADEVLWDRVWEAARTQQTAARP